VVDRNSGGVFKVPALPIRKDNIRQRVPETPTHTGGLPTAAREALAARLKARNMPTNLAVGGTLALSADTREMRDSRPGEKGLGEFARRGNRGLNREERNYDRDNRDNRGDHRAGRNDDRSRNDQARPKSWNDAPTPRTNRTDRDMDGGSMRVPNRGWDETPRTSSRGGPSGRGPSRAWDAPTPRRGRDGSPNADGEDGMHLDAKEWEEEQVRLDRDWYSTYDEGAVVSFHQASLSRRSYGADNIPLQAGDDEHNPFAGYEDVTREQETLMQAKQAKKLTAKQAQWVRRHKTCLTRGLPRLI